MSYQTYGFSDSLQCFIGDCISPSNRATKMSKAAACVLVAMQDDARAFPKGRAARGFRLRLAGGICGRRDQRSARRS